MAETWNTRTYSLDLRGFLSLCYPFFVFVVLRTLASQPLTLRALSLLSDVDVLLFKCPGLQGLRHKCSVSNPPLPYTIIQRTTSSFLTVSQSGNPGIPSLLATPFPQQKKGSKLPKMISFSSLPEPHVR